MLKVRIVADEGVCLPAYATEGSAGMDIRARLIAPVELAPGERTLVPTGLRIELPIGYEAQIRARSGLAMKHGLSMPNGIGTIDSDYRGEIKVALINLGQEPFVIRDGDRIAQMVVAACARVEWEPAERLTDSERGDGGFGHTGI
ncbi:MAG: dUTP diphosphatase [Clostridiales Family XIII bacterium]|jgi:dUTP pyrophosphatase|nr:dUTP diphosphatase [Clostridiales Family XIII bacterium]